MEMMKMSDKLFYRSIRIMPEDIDEKNRTIQVSFSSETPVRRRYYGDEILLHGKNNVDLEYINTVGSVLKRHGGEMSDIVGPVKKAWIDEERGMAIIGFDDDENGNLAISKVKSGSLRGISCGYQITKGMRLDDESDVWVNPETGREYRGPAVVATEWMPHEITLTPIPADHSVGFNRSLVDNIDFDNKNKRKEDNTMNEQEIKQLVKDTVKEAVRAIKPGPSLDDIKDEIRSIIKEESTPKIQVDRDALSDLCSRAAAISEPCKSKVTDMALEGRSHIEMLTFINDEAVKNPDARHRKSDNDDRHDKNAEKGFRSIDDIPDDLFVGSFR
jgi:hypothetical protein